MMQFNDIRLAESACRSPTAATDDHPCSVSAAAPQRALFPPPRPRTFYVGFDENSQASAPGRFLAPAAQNPRTPRDAY